MKRICAWCQKTYGYKCPLCGEELFPPDQPNLRGLYMECRGSTPHTRIDVMHQSGLFFSIERMKETHGMCDECQTRLIAERTAALQKKGVPPAPTERRGTRHD